MASHIYLHTGSLKELLEKFKVAVEAGLKNRSYGAYVALCSDTRAAGGFLERAFGVDPECTVDLVREFGKEFEKVRLLLESVESDSSLDERQRIHVRGMASNVKGRMDKLEALTVENKRDKDHPLGTRYSAMRRIGKEMIERQRIIREELSHAR